jgi:hypothetical protein
MDQLTEESRLIIHGQLMVQLGIFKESGVVQDWRVIDHDNIRIILPSTCPVAGTYDMDLAQATAFCTGIAVATNALRPLIEKQEKLLHLADWILSMKGV